MHPTQPHASMKVPPHRKGNYGDATLEWGLHDASMKALSQKEGKFTHDPTNDIPGGGLNESPHPKAEKCRCI